MQPHDLLHAMVNDHRQQLLHDAGAFRHGRQGRSPGPGPIMVMRRAVGTRLIQAGQATIGTPVAVAGQRA